MAFVAVDSALALLQVDRVGGQVPVDHGVTVEMEVETLLTDRGGGQHEGPKRGVEGPPHRRGSLQLLLVLGPFGSEAEGETATESVVRVVLAEAGHVPSHIADRAQAECLPTCGGELVGG